ncbi:tumor necrosis factor ligand superfamily member 6-like [Etheostoma cragini]|uniref:tumor necrosis factor ligand superfamily member 6-like n=1 Tax=Etheostoma cragini TaxID=417921 RepID=UPI00155E7003|nr:tumor necrosis factor ligand superfamily member 6-like [Etheostoma cragini]
MEMLYGSREWETGCMEEEGCCCFVEGEGEGEGEGEAGLHRKNALFNFLRQKEKRLRRMAQFLAAALLLLVALVLALLVTVVLGVRCHHQPMMQPDSQAGVSDGQQQPKDFKNPSAMLTVPRDNSLDGDYLTWESEDGNAFCHGGFNYSSGNLVVPRKGFYRVFLQITYESKDGFKCPSDEVLRLTNEVFVISDSYNENIALLSSVDTVNCSMKQWIKSTYTAGLFLLDANSRLRVKSSYRDLITKKETQVFFGAELLP